MVEVCYRPQNLLITGGCGFIGSNLIRLLLRGTQGQKADPQDDNQAVCQIDDAAGQRSEHGIWPGCLVVNLDKLTYAGNPESLKDLKDDQRYRFVQGDVADSTLVERVLSEYKIDTVLHLAAESHVDRSILDSTPFVQTNIVGTQVLLDACRRAGIARYVQVSTDEVYGSLGAEGYFQETTPLAPNSPYSASKAAADLLVRSYCHTFDFSGLITRCSNNYGPYQFPEKLIPLCIANALSDQPLPVYGDGRQVRDWIHVTDHCRGIIATVEKGTPGEVYNFGGECEWENLELVKLLLKTLGKPESLIRFVADRPGHDRRYAIDCQKAAKNLGWTPEVSFEQGMQQTICWYQKNSDWIDRIRTGVYRKYYTEQYQSRLGSE